MILSGPCKFKHRVGEVSDIIYVGSCSAHIGTKVKFVVCATGLICEFQLFSLYVFAMIYYVRYEASQKFMAILIIYNEILLGIFYRG